MGFSKYCDGESWDGRGGDGRVMGWNLCWDVIVLGWNATGIEFHWDRMVFRWNISVMGWGWKGMGLGWISTRMNTEI